MFRFINSLFGRVMIALVAGIALGALFPHFGQSLKPFGDGFLWLAIKVSFVLLIFIWVRATFPRYRYDQIMRLGWKVFIPITIAWVFVAGCFKYLGWFPLG